MKSVVKNSPKRIQLRRTCGWRLPARTVVVARPSKWGNPFRVGPDVTPDMAVTDYHEWLKFSAAGRLICTAARHVLRGKHLACWCPPGQPCHADILLKIANQ